MKGFTLIGLLVCMAVVGVLAAVVVLNLSAFIEAGKRAEVTVQGDGSIVVAEDSAPERGMIYYEGLAKITIDGNTITITIEASR